MNIGEKILLYRKKAQLSQEQLADKVGVTRQTISNWELNESSPDLKEAEKLTQIFNINLSDLVSSSLGEEVSNRIVPIISDRTITIISKIENVVVNCSGVSSSKMYKSGKNGPKYALFALNNSSSSFSNNTFLGWYKNKEDISKEVVDIYEARDKNLPNYELKYNVEVEKKFLGMSLRLKKYNDIK